MKASRSQSQSLTGWRNASLRVRSRHHTRALTNAAAPLVDIKNASFYNEYPSSSLAYLPPAIFPNLTFRLPANVRGDASAQQHWSVLSPSSRARTTFLNVLAGGLVCQPPTARSHPYFTTTLSAHPSALIRYIGFDAERTSPGAAMRGAYLSARYESRKESTDFCLLDFLIGNTELNTRIKRGHDPVLLQRCIQDLRLEKLLSMPVGNLSNGQTRRARIAKALMAAPELLLLDGPFMGLDPPSVALLSEVLHRLAVECRPRMVLSLRNGDPIPDWITHLVAISSSSDIQSIGSKQEVLESIIAHTSAEPSAATGVADSRPTFRPRNLSTDTIVSIQGAHISYGQDPILGHWPGGLQLNLHRGSRLAVLGPNGSGKTTLLSLITSDHPQTYAQPVKLFGRSRLPDPTAGEVGISVFELQRRMGHVSPEVHAFFPRELNVRRTLESAWADAPLARPDPPLSSAAKARVDGVLRAFRDELDSLRRSSPTDRRAIGTPDDDLSWSRTTTFRDLSFSSQRLLLFLRALVAGQELLILDEAFFGMDAAVRARCYDVLENGVSLSTPPSEVHADDGAVGETKQGDLLLPGLSDNQALLLVAHDKTDVPDCVREWICLPEAAGRDQEQKPPRMGELPGPISAWPEEWDRIWGLK